MSHATLRPETEEPISDEPVSSEGSLADEAFDDPREGSTVPKASNKVIGAVFVLVALLGVLAGSLIPQLSQGVRRVVGSVPLPAFARFAETRGPAPPPSKDANLQGSAAPRVRAEPEGEKPGEGLVKLTDKQVTEQDIQVVAVGSGALSRHIVVPGTIAPDADRIARVPARVVGTVAEMRKRLGDMVKKGEVVAVLDSREVADAKSEYLTASVNFDLQKTNFERQQSLWDKRISAELQYLQSRATFTESQLRFDLARQKLSALGVDGQEVAKLAKQDSAASGRSSLRQYEIRSPISGRVVERKVDVGTAVGKEGDPSDLYTIADLSTVWVDLTVTPNDLSKVKEGARVTLIASGDEEKRAEARISFVSPILTQETRSARVIASLDNKDLGWRPGSFVTAEIEIAREPARVIVPRAALQTIGGERVAFVRVPEGFQRRDVKVGRADDEAFEIVSGLAVGDEIAVKNTFLLKAELGKTEAAHND